MKSLNKKILTFIFVVAFAILMPFGNVKAALQANPNTHYKKNDTIYNWMRQIRNMEKSGGAMGLSETLNRDYTASSKSNGIDVHMMKSTEYGAIAILSASGYGNPSKLQSSSIKTTTGNKTGVYFSGNSNEWVSGGGKFIPGGDINNRYYDSYESSNSSAKVGDALGDTTTANPGCAGWHSSSANWASSGDEYFIRGGSGLFGFSYSKQSIGSSYITFFCRGIAVVGEGL